MSTLNLPDLEVYELKVHVLTFLDKKMFHLVMPNKKWLHDFTIVEISYPQREGYNHSITFDKSQNVYDILKGIKEKQINCTHLRSEIFKQLKCQCCRKTCMSNVVCVCGKPTFGGGWGVEWWRPPGLRRARGVCVGAAGGCVVCIGW